MKLKVICAVRGNIHFHPDQDLIDRIVDLELSKLGLARDSVKLYQETVLVSSNRRGHTSDETVTTVVANLEY